MEARSSFRYLPRARLRTQDASPEPGANMGQAVVETLVGGLASTWIKHNDKNRIFSCDWPDLCLSIGVGVRFQMK